MELSPTRRRAVRHLPRDARDTLFQLAVIGWTIVPHAIHLAPWCVMLAVLILGARARLAFSGGALPSRWTLLAVLVLAVVLTLVDERTLLGKDAGVTMLVVLMALKTLELRARRDAMVVFMLGFFLVLTNFLYSQGPFVAFAMLVSVWGLLTALVLAHMTVGTPPIRAAGAVAARAALLGAPIMIALFLLFPRLAPLWGLPQDAGGRTGLSGSLELGGVANLANDDSVALRVRFPQGAPAFEELYFRGPVLSRFDGRTWTRSESTFSTAGALPAELETLGRPVPYEMTLEPSRLALLPTLEATPARGDDAPVVEGYLLRFRADLEWLPNRPLAERVRMRATAWPQFRHGPRLGSLALREYLALPPGFNPRALAWAAQLRASLPGADANTLAAALYKQVQDHEYIYTLEPGPYGRDAIDEFWLDRRLGFCEHYASAFVVLMRAMDVPARIVTGYQGADTEPVDGYYIVRKSHAHAWAEYWQPGQGWTRADPTAAVAPHRIRRGESLPPTAGLVAEALNGMNPALAARVRQLWEAMDNRWNQWVLNYSRSQQFDLLRGLGVDAPQWEDLVYALIGLLSAASLGGAGWALWDRLRQDPWWRLQQRILARLRALGVTVAPHDPPRTRAAAVRAGLGAAGEPLARALERLDHQRYGRHRESLEIGRWWRQFAAEAARLPPRPRAGAEGA